MMNRIPESFVGKSFLLDHFKKYGIELRREAWEGISYLDTVLHNTLVRDNGTCINGYFTFR